MHFKKIFFCFLNNPSLKTMKICFFFRKFQILSSMVSRCSKKAFLPKKIYLFPLKFPQKKLIKENIFCALNCWNKFNYKLINQGLFFVANMVREADIQRPTTKKTKSEKTKTKYERFAPRIRDVSGKNGLLVTWIEPKNGGVVVLVFIDSLWKYNNTMDGIAEFCFYLLPRHGTS